LGFIYYCFRLWDGPWYLPILSFPYHSAADHVPKLAAVSQLEKLAWKNFFIFLLGKATFIYFILFLILFCIFLYAWLDTLDGRESFWRSVFVFQSAHNKKNFIGFIFNSFFLSKSTIRFKFNYLTF